MAAPWSGNPELCRLWTELRVSAGQSDRYGWLPQRSAASARRTALAASIWAACGAAPSGSAAAAFLDSPECRPLLLRVAAERRDCWWRGCCARSALALQYRAAAEAYLAAGHLYAAALCFRRAASLVSGREARRRAEARAAICYSVGGARDEPFPDEALRFVAAWLADSPSLRSHTPRTVDPWLACRILHLDDVNDARIWAAISAEARTRLEGLFGMSPGCRAAHRKTLGQSRRGRVHLAHAEELLVHLAAN